MFLTGYFNRLVSVIIDSVVGNLKDIVVIGAGPGGYHVAVLLARLGFNVTLIEKEHIGGTCLNIGCIPTKALLDHTSLFEHFQGVLNKKKIYSGSDIKINTENLRAFQIDIISQLKAGLERLFNNKKIKLVSGEAKILSSKKIRVNNNTDIEADHIIIAVGSEPKTVPGFNFDKNIIVSSDDIWNIPRVPKNFLIIGSGPIGVEFARVFQVLGSKVTIAEIKEKICPLLDTEISENLARSLKRRGINLKPNCASKFVKLEDGLVTVEFLSTVGTSKETNQFDMVLVAVGREPNTKNLGLENAHVELEGSGFIKVNSKLQTSEKNIWAVGDVTNYPQLAHTASFQARVVADNINGKETNFNGNVIPSCIFGYPEVAFVGATEDELKEKKINYKTGKYLFLGSGKAKASGLTEGLVKILMDANTKKILGAHIIGSEASNLIHELVVAMQNSLTVEQVAHSIHAHPTYSEVVLEALEDCLGAAVHV